DALVTGDETRYAVSRPDCDAITIAAVLEQWGGSARRMPLTRSGDHEGVDIITVPRPPSINDVVLQPVSRNAGGSAIGSVSPLSSGNQHIPSNPEHHQHRCQHSMHCA